MRRGPPLTAESRGVDVHLEGLVQVRQRLREREKDLLLRGVSLQDPCGGLVLGRVQDRVIGSHRKLGRFDGVAAQLNPPPAHKPEMRPNKEVADGGEVRDGPEAPHCRYQVWDGGAPEGRVSIGTAPEALAQGREQRFGAPASSVKAFKDMNTMHSNCRT